MYITAIYTKGENFVHTFVNIFYYKLIAEETALANFIPSTRDLMEPKPNWVKNPRETSISVVVTGNFYGGWGSKWNLTA